LQFIRDNNTLTRTSIPNHTSHRKDIKYAVIKSIRNTESLTKSIHNTESLTKSIQNTESLTKSIQNTESDWQ